MEKDKIPEEINSGNDFEEEITEVEEEIEEEESEKETSPVLKKQTTKQDEAVTETYEAFAQEERFGLTNTLTGELVEGFDMKRDQGHILAYKLILNKLNKISIALGI